MAAMLKKLLSVFAVAVLTFATCVAAQQLRDDAKRVLDKSFPNSEFLTRGFRKVEQPWWKVW